jgi:hypothetical protein
MNGAPGGERLEDVVELCGGEVDGDGLIAGDAAGVLEEADAVFVEGDAGDGELRGCGGFGAGGWLGRSFGGGLGCLCGGGEGKCKEEGGEADCLAHADRYFWPE